MSVGVVENAAGSFAPGGCVQQPLISAAQRAVDALVAADLSVVTAESCTGGLIAATLSCAPRAGQCLQGAFVVYSKAQKQLALGVSAELLARRGSVNREVAVQMAEGALQRSGAQIALSVTGVMGPDPDEDGNPAGLIYLAVARRAKPAVVVEECLAKGSPDEVRRHVVLSALELLCRAAALRLTP